jgi:hypothetical protein
VWLTRDIQPQTLVAIGMMEIAFVMWGIAVLNEISHCTPHDIVTVAAVYVAILLIVGVSFIIFGCVGSQ